MSRASSGPHLLAPEKPVKAFSEVLESSYEMLHRHLCSTLYDSGSLSSVYLFLVLGKSMFYGMRELLESDCGISRYVADSLPVPKSGDFLRRAYAYESSEEGRYEFQRLAANNPTHFKQPDDLEWLGFFERPDDFWRLYRFGVFELARCLRVTRTRIAEGVPPKTPYRFPWLVEYPQDFEDD
ncbi:hypothetical protein N9Z36_09240 [Luminiphilus sp.]|nr:hypothetical protein [Luminiphilus sp.]